MKLFFMHIAKAGGSTVNAYLTKHFTTARSMVHIQSSSAWQEDPAALLKKDFLSGHLSLKSLDDRIDLSGFRLVTVIREPRAQLVSHLAWIRRLADPGEEDRLHQHPEFVRVLAAKLAACDFHDAGAVATLAATLSAQERQLLDNCQTRYFAPPPPEWVGPPEAEQALAAIPRFHRIGLVEQLDDFLAAIAADMNWPAPGPIKRENVTPGFYGLEAMSDSVREALRPLYRHDQVLYEQVLKGMPGKRGLINRFVRALRGG